MKFSHTCRRIFALALFGLSCCRIGAAAATDLQAYTEEWAPYNFSEQGVLKGIATDILRAVCSEQKLRCTIDIVPWARAYATVANTPNALLYTTARKATREHEFLWVGPLLPRTTWVYGRAGSQREISSLQQLATHLVGVVRGEAAAQDLLAAGVPAANLRLDSTNGAVLKQLLEHWGDAMVDTEIGMAWNLRQAGLAPAKVVKLLKLTDDGAYYFALNRRSDPALREQLQRAVDQLRQNGGIDRIVRQYERPAN